MKRSVNQGTFRALEWAIRMANAAKTRNSYKQPEGRDTRIEEQVYYLTKLYIEIGGSDADILNSWDKLSLRQNQLLIKSTLKMKLT